MEIVIDSRENHLIAEFEKTGFEIKVKQLNIGDIIISYDSQIKIIFERKTISDLISSIKDGRHREQKFRMNEFKKETGCKIVYIYEGDMDFNTGIVQPPSVNGSFINTIFRDDIQIINTKNLKATKSLLIILFDKIKKDPDAYFLKNKLDSCIYNECISKTKKKNITVDNILINQIACIHGFSFKHAKAIQEHFEVSNIRDLINIIEKYISENKKDPLLQIKGIGKKMSSSFYEMNGIKNPNL